MNEHGSRLLDPWADAALIACRLQSPKTMLLVAVGAAQWCGKCSRLRPLFEALLQRHAPEPVITLWLDLEDHAELLGPLVVGDLPLLLLWRAGRCERAAVLLDVAPTAGSAHVRDLEPPASTPSLWADLARQSRSAPKP